MNSRDECVNKAMTEMFGCAYPSECDDSSDRTEECFDAYTNIYAIQSQCNLQCPAVCDQVRKRMNEFAHLF